MGWLSSCAAVLLLYLCPRFFAEGHYNNKDVVLLCLFLLTFWQGARLLRKPTLSRGMLLSFFGAMAFNTKIVGIFAWGLMGLAMIVSLTARKKWNRSMVGLAVATILSFVGFYVLLTPALWSDPIGFFHWCMDNAVNFSRFGGEVLFRGARFWDINQETPLPWYYLPFMILPIYSVIVKLDHSLIEAARDLGANSVQVFRRVILPLSLPGVLSGITMVFVPSVSTFAISKMLGGGTEMLLGDLIEQQYMGGAYNPYLGAAISLVMMVIVVICMVVMNRFGEGEEQAVMM